MVHEITHPHNLTRKKVNFFADYFDFAATHIGLDETIEIENILSLVDKIIFQIEKNLGHCHKYIDSYLSHPLFQENNVDLKDDNNYKELHRHIKKYKSQHKAKKKLVWLKNNPAFKESLLILKRSLQRKMFKSALRSVVSYLNCSHDIPTHKDDLIRLTNILVSEFVLNDRSKIDLKKTFQKILSKDVGEFPFPTKMINQSIEAKERFIQNRTFQQQFDGIFNLLNEPLKKHFFIFRIYAINTPNDFLFKYNKVSFYSYNHPVVAKLLENAQTNPFLKNFFKLKDGLMLAVVKAKYYSHEVAANEAIAIVKSELTFINRVFSINCRLEPFSYLLTADFNEFGWHRDVKEGTFRLTDDKRKLLDDNPFLSLINCPRNLKDRLLNNEIIFLQALSTKNVALYWQYLEAIIPTNGNNDKQIVDMVSHILLLNTEKYFRGNIELTIKNAILPFNTSADNVSLTKAQQQRHCNQIFKNGKINLKRLQKEINHPFLNELLKTYFKPFSPHDFQIRKTFYERILWETQAQRNSIVHNGFANDKALILLNGSLTRRVIKLRLTLFNEVRKRTAKDFEQLVNNLKSQAIALLSRQ